jgi:arylsulfatase A-like enzyme
MCAPSRFAVITGRYASRGLYAQSETVRCGNTNTVTDIVVPKTKLDLELTATVQTALKAAGYYTGVVGKWHLAAEAESPYLPRESAYPEKVAKAEATGMDYVDGFYVANMDGSCSPRGEQGCQYAGGCCSNSLGFSHNMEWVTAKALEFFAVAATEGKPFFLYMNPTVPHTPSPEEALNEISIRETPWGTLTADPVSTMPSRDDIFRRATEARQASRAGGQGPILQMTEAIGGTWIDDAVGAVYTYLQNAGTLDDTFFLFIMDHGTLGKETLYETGARIAMFVRYPNHRTSHFAAGTEYSNLVSNLDIAPTLIELATGSAPPEEYDGVSLLSPISDRTLFLELNKDRAAVTASAKLMLRELEGFAPTTGGGRLSCQATQPPPRSSDYAYADREQLYDLTDDPTEQSNIWNPSTPSSTQAALQAALSCHIERTAIGSTSFAPCPGEQAPLSPPSSISRSPPPSTSRSPPSSISRSPPPSISRSPPSSISRSPPPSPSSRVPPSSDGTNVVYITACDVFTATSQTPRWVVSPEHAGVECPSGGESARSCTSGGRDKPPGTLCTIGDQCPSEFQTCCRIARGECSGNYYVVIVETETFAIDAAPPSSSRPPAALPPTTPSTGTCGPGTVLNRALAQCEIDCSTLEGRRVTEQTHLGQPVASLPSEQVADLGPSEDEPLASTRAIVQAYAAEHPDLADQINEPMLAHFEALRQLFGQPTFA